LFKAIYANVPVLDSGARGSTTTFVERGLGDVLIAWENEAFLSLNELGKDKFEIVVPSVSILAELLLLLLIRLVDKKGTREVAEAYLEYLYSDEGQEIAAKNYYRPRKEEIKQNMLRNLPKLNFLPLMKSLADGIKRKRKF